MKLSKNLLMITILTINVVSIAKSDTENISFSDKNFRESVEKNNLERIQLFINNGYLEKKFEKNSPLSIIIEYGTADSLKLLLENKKLNKKGSYEAVLYFLIKMQKEEMAMAIVEYIQDPNFVLVEGSGVTLLHEAARHGMAEVCEKLIKAGASTQNVTIGKYLPLTLAIKNQHIKTTRYLLNITNFKNIDSTAKEVMLRNAVVNERSFTLLSDILSNDDFSGSINALELIDKISLERNDHKLKDYIDVQFKR